MYQKDFTFGRMLLAYRRPFKFTGRSTRTELVGYLIISWLLSAIASRALFFWTQGSEAADLYFPLTAAILLIPMPALAVRRAHDIGRPWYWALLLIVSLIIYYVLGQPFLSQSPLLLQGVMILNVLGLVILFWPPEEETNAYGPNPRFDDDTAYEAG